MVQHSWGYIDIMMKLLLTICGPPYYSASYIARIIIEFSLLAPIGRRFVWAVKALGPELCRSYASGRGCGIVPKEQAQHWGAVCGFRGLRLLHNERVATWLTTSANRLYTWKDKRMSTTPSTLSDVIRYD